MSANDKINGAVPVLKYFNFKGLGEGIRMMFEDQGIKYEDIRIAPVEWPAVKKQLIESGENPVGQVPVVIVNKKVLTQSSAIFRYFARIYDLYGSDSEEAYVVDVAVDLVADIRRDSTALLGTDEAAKEEFWKIKAPEQLQILDQMLRARGGPFILGDKISFADFIVYQLLLRYPPKFPEFKTKYKALDCHFNAVNGRPGIKEYLESDRVPK